MVDDKRLVFKKAGAKYHFFCTECEAKWTGTFADKTVYSKTGICPKCFNIIRTSKENDQIYRKCFLEGDEGYCYHYKVNCDGNEIIDKELIYKKEGKKQFRRNYHIYYQMYYWSYCVTEDAIRDNQWHRTYSENWEYAFYRHVKYDTKTKKQYLLNTAPLDLKTNQKYLVMNNHLNPAMMVAIMQFDLKSVDPCYKYSKYINSEFGGHRQPYKTILNETDLVYLSNKKISIRDYIDYLNTCKAIGIKDKHPKDFPAAEAKVFEIKEQKNAELKQQECGKRIAKRFKQLKKASNKKMVVMPYRDCFELFNDANEFKNCIYRCYTDKYAQGETDLYRCTIDDKLIACIEIKDNEIIQIRGEHNSTPKEEQAIRRMLNKQIIGATA